MANSDSDWRKMLRVISGGVGKDILKEERERQKEEYPVDRSLFSIKDWDTEFVFRNLINRQDLTEGGRKLIELAHSRFRQQEMTSFMQQNQDSLSTWAVLDQGDTENNGNSFRDIMHFTWHFKYDLGPWMQGKLIEIIGPMRSGKNNFVVYLSRAAMANKIHVITSFPMFFPTTKDGPLKDYYAEAHGLREALLYMLHVRYKEPEAIFFLILDEQTTRGASNMRPNATEAEWANGWIVRSGHFGCTTIRLMQSGDETIKMQKSLRYVEIYKNPRSINRAEGKFVTFGDEWPITFQNIPDMAKYYNTASPGSWMWDLDPQAMNDYMSLHETETNGDTEKIYRFYERYINILKRTEDPYWFINKKYRYLDKEATGDETVLAENSKEEKIEPLPLHHENCPKNNGLIWTWTPNRYYKEGEWAKCSRCKKNFKVHYSADDGAAGSSGNNSEVQGNSVDSSDLMSEGYRGSGHEENSGQVPRGDTASLNTQSEDIPGHNGEEVMVSPLEAAEGLAADAFNLFLDVVSGPEMMKARELDPEPKSQFKELMDTQIPPVDTTKVTEKASRKRKWSQQVPELQEESLRLRQQAADKGECANCGKQLTGNQIYYCSDDCKSEFYANHPTSVRWNDLRSKALERDNNKCVKCGGPADEVDHIKEIWEGGSEFDLDNLQSLCHNCHVAKTNKNRRKRQV